MRDRAQRLYTADLPTSDDSRVDEYRADEVPERLTEGKWNAILDAPLEQRSPTEGLGREVRRLERPSVGIAVLHGFDGEGAGACRTGDRRCRVQELLVALVRAVAAGESPRAV